MNGQVGKYMNPVLWASNEDRKRDPSRVGLI